jgi:hypothetical protein
MVNVRSDLVSSGCCDMDLESMGISSVGMDVEEAVLKTYCTMKTTALNSHGRRVSDVHAEWRS